MFNIDMAGCYNMRGEHIPTHIHIETPDGFYAQAELISELDNPEYVINSYLSGDTEEMQSEETFDVWDAWLALGMALGIIPEEETEN